MTNKFTKVFSPPKSNRQFTEGQKSKGILDDFSQRQNVKILETPVEDLDAANKKYVDNAGHWDKTGTNVHLKTSTDDVGIGTDTPLGKLDVRGDIFTDRFLLQDSNTFLGIDAAGSGLEHTTAVEGYQNVAIGNRVLQSITKGAKNTAMGYQSLMSLTTGQNNFGLGGSALRDLTTGAANIAIGTTALWALTGNSHSNVAIGHNAGRGVFGVSAFLENVLIGRDAGKSLTTGGDNVMIGYQAGDDITTGANNIIIGVNINPPTVGTDDHINIGNTIYGDISTGNVRIAGSISSATHTFTAAGPTNNVDVAGINTLFIDTSDNNVTIGGFSGGVDGQKLSVVKCCPSNDVTLEHNHGGGSEEILLHNGADETIDGHFGGWSFVGKLSGADIFWYDTSHAKHV